ncbi:MAG: flagellar biosynthetic protein FliQ [bacterium]
MTVAFIIEIVRTALMTAALIAGPILLSALVVGLTVSLFMAVTQVNEATLTFIPKILTVGVVLILMLPWITGKATWFMEYIFTNFPDLIR